MNVLKNFPSQKYAMQVMGAMYSISQRGRKFTTTIDEVRRIADLSSYNVVEGAKSLVDNGWITIRGTMDWRNDETPIEVIIHDNGHTTKLSARNPHPIEDLIGENRHAVSLYFGLIASSGGKSSFRVDWEKLSDLTGVSLQRMKWPLSILAKARWIKKRGDTRITVYSIPGLSSI